MSKLEVCSLQEFVEYDLVEQMKEWEEYKEQSQSSDFILWRARIVGPCRS